MILPIGLVLLVAGIAAMWAASRRKPLRLGQPLFENGLILASIGLVLILVFGAIEAAVQLIALMS